MGHTDLCAGPLYVLDLKPMLDSARRYKSHGDLRADVHADCSMQPIVWYFEQLSIDGMCSKATQSWSRAKLSGRRGCAARAKCVQATLMNTCRP